MTGRKVGPLPNVKPTKEISIVLPAYNEASQIEECILKLERSLRRLSDSYEIIVSEDGSTDRTDQIVTSISKCDTRLILLHSPTRLGKGKAIKNAIKQASGKIIVFMDVDLSTNLDYLPRLLMRVKEKGGIAIGSRHVQGARVQRRMSRTLFSLAYNLFVRMLFSSSVHDHQCGFKAISREAAKELENIESNGFFFDTEMILRCEKRGFHVEELGVEWSENRTHSTSKVSLFRDAAKIGMEALRYRLGSTG